MIALIVKKICAIKAVPKSKKEKVLFLKIPAKTLLIIKIKKPAKPKEYKALQAPSQSGPKPAR